MAQAEARHVNTRGLPLKGARPLDAPALAVGSKNRQATHPEGRWPRQKLTPTGFVATRLVLVKSAVQIYDE